MRVRGPNNIGRAVQRDKSLLRLIRFGDHEQTKMLGVVGSKV